MSDAAAAAAQVPAKKAPKAKKAVKPSEHPKYCVMIASAITDRKDRGGSSRQAILKYVQAHFKVGNEPKKVNARLKTALRAGVKAGTLKQAKGTGASGSFRLGEKTIAKPKVKKAKKPKAAAKKPKSPAKKKPAAKKAKSPAKKAAAKKPKSPPKKAAAKKPKSPVKKPAAKKPKAPAKKAAAKKPAKK